MENRIEKSDGIEIPKKKRSLDLKSLYKSSDLKGGNDDEKKISNNSLKRKQTLEGGGNGKIKKKKRSHRKKDTYVCSFENGGKKSCKSIEEVYSGGLSSGSGDLKKTQLGVNQIAGSSSSNSSKGQKLNGPSLILDQNVIQIPKRKRDFKRRKQFDSDKSKGTCLSTGKGGVSHQFNKLLNDSARHDESGSNNECPKVKRKKLNDDQALHPAGPSGTKNGAADQLGELSSDSGLIVDSCSNVESLKVKQNKVLVDHKENTLNRANGSSVPHKPKGGNGVSVVSNDDISTRNIRKNHSKRTKLSANNKSSSKEAETPLEAIVILQEDDEEKLGQNDVSVVNNGDSSRKPQKNRSKRKKNPANNISHSKVAKTSLEAFSILQEDEEENLEQNAARMLSSRFDPSCTGLSKKRLYSSLSSDQVGCSMTGLESASVDAAGRVLRQRRSRKNKGLLRKRRHFYEISPLDLDAKWVLNRRIKVFWPLDKIWYFGLINDYDSTKDLHHVKYDDRDEEWINLQNERFKLLLFPSEVSGKTEIKTPVVGVRHTEKKKGDMHTNDGSLTDSYLDSEPIISWLAQTTRRAKLSSFSAKKKNAMTQDLVPRVLSEKIVNVHTKHVKNKSSSFQSPTDNNDDRVEKSILENELTQDVTPPIVYFRKRFRQRSPQYSAISMYDGNNHVHKSVPDRATSLVLLDVEHEVTDKFDTYLEQSEQLWPLWCLDKSGELKLTLPTMKSKQFQFFLSFPDAPDIYFSVPALDFWLLHDFTASQYGTVTKSWPVVHLEMLFVDNIVGLSLFLFECCLTQAVAFVFLSLTLFDQKTVQGKYSDVQMPLTSLRVKFSCTRDLKKHLVFSFFNFSKIKKSKLLSLDFKLKRHCLVSKNLPLSECTNDKVKVLESGRNQLHLTSGFEEPSSSQALQNKFGKAIILPGASKQLACVNTSQFSSRYMELCKGSFPLSFEVVPSFFVGLHLELLMERATEINFPDHESMSTLNETESSGTLMVLDNTPINNFSNKVPAIIPVDSLSNSLVDPTSSRSDVDLRVASYNLQIGDLNNSEISSCSPKLEQLLQRPPLVLSYSSSPRKVCSVPSSHINGNPPSNQDENMVQLGTSVFHMPNNLDSDMNDGVSHSPNHTELRTLLNHSKNGPSLLSYVSPDGKSGFYFNDLLSVPKKPRTRVSYTMLSGEFDLNAKHRSQNQKRNSTHKRIRRASDKRTTIDRSKSTSQKNLEFLSCEANVLITVGDRGWRESGATIVVELVDGNEWRLAVKISGSTRYSYKAHQILQSWSTNRYTHAIVWRGGKDWSLEFPDRTQWVLFKEMHEECCDRNLRAASVKNIPIPGVRLIEDDYDNGSEATFVRSFPNYIRQIESDVDMALDSSRIIYDIDSGDEQWILNSSESDEQRISIELFEKIMDIFEKISYTQQRDQFAFEEIEEFMLGVAPADVIKIIYEYWRQKRQRKGMSLIRQLQPPLWERYQQEVKEWELAMAKTSNALSNGSQDKTVLTEKPPMIAFCLKPRGLEVPNKGSKQRSHRRFPVSGNINTSWNDHEVYNPFGRSINVYSLRDEKLISTNQNHEPLEAYSPRDADGYERNHHPQLRRTKSKKIRTFLPNNSQQNLSLNQRTVGKQNRWNMGGLLEWPHRPDIEMDSSVLDEIKSRDASRSAKLALNMSKLKREKAQKMLYRADIAINKAMVALMTADAIKIASENESNGDEKQRENAGKVDE